MVIEVRTEDVLAPALPLGMLLPKQRVRGSREEIVEVVHAERPYHDELSGQGGLAIHSSSPSSSHSRHTQSPSRPSSALNAAGTIVTPQRGQIGGRSSFTRVSLSVRALESELAMSSRSSASLYAHGS